MKYYGRRKISLVSLLSYLNGLSKENQNGYQKIESHIKLNADSIIIDFSQTNVPLNEAIIFLKIL